MILYCFLGIILTTIIATTLIPSVNCSTPLMYSHNFGGGASSKYNNNSPWMINPYYSTSFSSGRSRRTQNIFGSEKEGYCGYAKFVSSRREQSSSSQVSQQQDVTSKPENFPDISYQDLGPIGKTIAGITEIVFATALEYVSGFFTGILLGTLVGLPGFAFKASEPGIRKALGVEIKSRFIRMNTRSLSWAKNFGSISAAFGGFGVAVKVLRNGEEDVWNSILSSAAAGAFFARKEGPQAMLRGAVLYGGLIYLVSGGVGKNKQLQEYTERPVSNF